MSVQLDKFSKEALIRFIQLYTRLPYFTEQQLNEKLCRIERDLEIERRLQKNTDILAEQEKLRLVTLEPLEFLKQSVRLIKLFDRNNRALKKLLDAATAED